MDRRDTCLLEPRRSKTHLSSPAQKSKEGNGRFDPSLRAELIQNIDRRLRELTFNDSLCPVRKSMPSRPVVLELQNDDILRRRGSVYQSSKEMGKMRSQIDPRRKVGINKGGEDFLSFEILNSSTLCPHAEDRKTVQSNNTSQNASNSDLRSALTNAMEMIRENPAEILDMSSHLLPDEIPSTSGSDGYIRRDDKLDGVLEISLTDEDHLCHSKATSEVIAGGVDDNKTSKRDNVKPLENGANALPERDKLQALPKSFSTKVELLNSPRQADDVAHRSDTRSRYSAFRRILDPIGKSKSQRNPSSLADISSTRTDDLNNVKVNNGSVTSETNSLTSTTRDTENVQPVIQGKQGVPVASPVHFKGILKQENRQGILYFEFFSKDSDDVLTARKWKTDSTLNWVYTFYTTNRKSNTTGRAVKDRNQSPTLIGQMQASCYLCSEVGKNGSVDSSTVSEFVLYDIAQARRSIAADEGSQTSRRTMNHPKAPDVDVNGTPLSRNNPPNREKANLPSRHGHDPEGDTSHLLPWPASKLLPHLEIAAIMVNIPFEKKVKLKDRKNETCAKPNADLSTLSVTDQCKIAVSNGLCSANVKVITPSSRHSLPNEGGCPSPLLHRWRSGGGCDCGGWDMGCSIVVFEANAMNDSGDNLSENLHQTFMLSVQGSRDSLPAFALKSHAEGYHSICFHAQLSSLQAFSISVAMLHSLTSPSSDALVRGAPVLHSNSLKLLLEEEVKQLLNVVVEEEKRKPKIVIEPMPPFSPIGRV